MPRSSQAFLLALLLVLAAACAAPEKASSPEAAAPVAEAPQYLPGDSWNYTGGYFQKVIGHDGPLLITTGNFSKTCENCRSYRDSNYTAVKVLDASGRPAAPGNCRP